MSQLNKAVQAEFIPPLYSICALSGLGDAHPHWGESTALLSLPIQMLISQENILTKILSMILDVGTLASLSDTQS